MHNPGFNSLQIGLNRIHNIRHFDSNLWDASAIFSSVQVPGFHRLNQVGESANIPTSYSVKDDVSWNRGAHSLKFGVEVKRADLAYSQRSENKLIWPSREAYVVNELNQVNLIGGVPMRGLYKTLVFGYVQDQWKARPNLTVNLGLRYDFFNGWREKYGRSEPFDLESCGGPCPRGSQFVLPVKTNFSPRVSIAWSPAALDSRVVIRTGFGLYRGEGQLTDIKEPSDNDTERFTLTRVDFPDLNFPADGFHALAKEVAVAPRMLVRRRSEPTVAQ